MGECGEGLGGDGIGFNVIVIFEESPVLVIDPGG